MVEMGGVRPVGCEERLGHLEKQIARLMRRETGLRLISNKYWRARRTILGGGLILTVAAYGLAGDSALLLALLISVSTFAAVAHVHGKVLASIRRNSEWANLKRSQIARIRLQWDSIPRPSASRTIPGHPFDLDLDITGETSLHRLLDVAMTIEGSDRLLEWLLNTVPDLQEIGKRQAMVRELAGLTLFREKLLLYSMQAAQEIGGQWQSGRLLQWLNRHAESRWLFPALITLCGLALVNVASFSLFAAGVLPGYWGIGVLVYLSVMWWRREDVGSSFSEATALENALKQVLGVFTHLERYSHRKV